MIFDNKLHNYLVVGAISLVSVFSILKYYHGKERRLVKRCRTAQYSLKSNSSIKVKSKSSVNSLEEVLDSSVRALLILDTIEKELLPLTCSGVVMGHPLYGSIVLRRDNSTFIACANSQEAQSPIQTSEILALEEASLLLNNSEAVGKCFLVCSHKNAITNFGLSAIKKCNISTVYVLFDANKTGADAVIKYSETETINGIEILPFTSLIGKIEGRKFQADDEKEMNVKLKQDKVRANILQRLQMVGKVYDNLRDEVNLAKMK